ncbi:MAG: O-linked N-acetylglucosamine transferase, SPINDLY family protein [Coleofasciculus sp. A1-SPW-01]|uniref:O-linked N-acetylglucosamine transferase, SPINDLY family protein n=1 Tax=Coleofasciculus sp. A1-SPW-01 TaxID=3070819 RepID=UPI0032FF3F51
MNSDDITAHSPSWAEQARHYWLQGDYTQAAALYEQAIANQPEVMSHYWHGGLMLLLQGDEAAAQTTWALAMMEGEAEQVQGWTLELSQVLEAEAERQEAISQPKTAWLIRQHLREIAPEDFTNCLRIVQLALTLETFTADDLANFHQSLQTVQADTIDTERLRTVLEQILEVAPDSPLIAEFIHSCLSVSCDAQPLIEVVMEAAGTAFRHEQPALAAQLALVCYRYKPHDLGISYLLSLYYQYSHQYSESIAIAREHYTRCQTLPKQIQGNFLLLRSLMIAGGHWQESLLLHEKHQLLLQTLLAEQPKDLHPSILQDILPSLYFFPYFTDTQPSDRQLQNQVAQFCQDSFQTAAAEQVKQFQQKVTQRRSSQPVQPLKIGYLSHCLRQHSVGWIARWLFKYHNQEQFQIHAFSMQSRQNDSVEQFITHHCDRVEDVSTLEPVTIAQKIAQAEIDILVDLDSLTSSIACAVMALKPAPVQVSWLGLDASGLPAIDYFIADPYVLPESAQAEYSETLWRLPQTYVAVDGFEVAVPSRRRDLLDIPNDAVVYFSSQRGFKRHPDSVRLQMQILNAVPNSYFLLKGDGDPETIRQFFEQLAEEEGVASDRLRFLPWANSETIHRANLGIANVVLDTYPYNGATTTLETLWMGVPLVTRVGQQFAARNSYTMMINAGITEGIAWSDEEYVEWGIRLGKDTALREQISWKLRQSRHTAPLWNAKQFTREMEKAYQQMWVRYLEESK